MCKRILIITIDYLSVCVCVYYWSIISPSLSPLTQNKVRDPELPWGSLYHFVVKVPQDTREIRSVHIPGAMVVEMNRKPSSKKHLLWATATSHRCGSRSDGGCQFVKKRTKC